MSVRLLDKTRKINKLLHNNTGYKISQNDLCMLLGGLLYSNVMLTDQHGDILGLYESDNIPVIGYMPGLQVGDGIDSEMNERFMSVLSTKENVNLNMLGLDGDNYEHYDAIIIPVDISGERLGTVFVYRLKQPYDIDDIILGEYAAAIMAMELLHDVYEAGQGNHRREGLARSAVRSLSSSELLAAKYVFDELKKSDGILVTSRVAEKYGITRSVIVNAIKKLNSAGVVRSKSMGAKGTAVRIDNEYIADAVNSMIIDN